MDLTTLQNGLANGTITLQSVDINDVNAIIQVPATQATTQTTPISLTDIQNAITTAEKNITSLQENLVITQAKITDTNNQITAQQVIVDTNTQLLALINSNLS